MNPLVDERGTSYDFVGVCLLVLAVGAFQLLTCFLPYVGGLALWALGAYRLASFSPRVPWRPKIAWWLATLAVFGFALAIWANIDSESLPRVIAGFLTLSSPGPLAHAAGARR